MPDRYDALIIGGGHNGLVCAFYLARSGMKVRVLERRASWTQTDPGRREIWERELRGGLERRSGA